MTEPLTDAEINLRDCQRQLDRDGTMVGVSRQALEEVLDLVSALRAQVERLEKEREWRPIAEFPPSEVDKSDWPIDTRVLVCGPHFGIHTGYCRNWHGKITGNVASYHGDAVADWGVTHFMPLPAPPKGED